MSDALDLNFVRAQFPALAGGWIYFDNAGGAQVLEGVTTRIREFMLDDRPESARGLPPPVLAAERVRTAEQGVADLINAADRTEVVMGPSTTQLLAHLAAAMADEIRPGDEIIVTEVDHESNIGPWLRLRDRGANIVWWRVDRDRLGLMLEDLERLLTPRTRLVCVTHTSNILGDIAPIPEIVRLAHDAGAQVCVDGVALAPHRLVDVRAWDVDYYVFSWYKFFGPHHAVLYGRRDHLLALSNLNHYFFSKEDLPDKLQPGHANKELSYGVLGILDYLRALGQRLGVPAQAGLRAHTARAFDAIAAHEEALAERLLGYLRTRPGVTVIGRTAADRTTRIPIISFTVRGLDSGRIPPALFPHGLVTRAGHFYAKRLIEALDLEATGGVVRISMAHYNTLAEVEALIDRLEAIL
ncbi:MAG: cysteine desulfurase-like protein [Armatimonadota bacterium]|nr:cysteine desulfurase-like protein [Armatimonadota bacterium]MDR7488516.1 cysteine desulfurase-like protein [Armatimonadota bacterium]MDR7573793.1 cysteine desulfurase-like protein [Armatimonadota bacterium]MDR7586540.1 cysteine desulfurase-like protein [Armatimonadota bacterium]